MPTVALLGDSILDNFYWLADRGMDLRAQLMGLGYTTYNFAVDESQLRHVVFGVQPRDHYIQARSYPYPMVDGQTVRPLQLLNLIQSDLTVISVGGNDLRVNLHRLRNGVSTLINTIFNAEYTKAFDHVIQTSKLLTVKSRVILVSPYCPYLGMGSRYRLLIPIKDELLGQIRAFYYKLGQAHNVPVLDLSLTFNPYDRSHYGSTEIEPSNLSSQCIANCIDHIYTHYKGYAIYSAPKLELKLLSDF